MPEWWVVVLAIGAVARLTRLCTRDVILAPARNAVARRFGDHSRVTELTRCGWCISVWFALPVTLAAALFGQSAWFWGPALFLTVAWAAAVADDWANA